MRLNGGEDCRHVSGNFHLVPNSKDLAVFPYEQRRSLDPHVFAAIHALFDPDSIGHEHCFRVIEAERDCKLVPGFKSRVARR
jgi:hypothetical protein